MTPLVKICKENNCSLVITDVTQDSDQYVGEFVANTKPGMKEINLNIVKLTQ